MFQKIFHYTEQNWYFNSVILHSRLEQIQHKKNVSKDPPMVSIPNGHTNFEMLKQKIWTLDLSEILNFAYFLIGENCGKIPCLCHFKALKGHFDKITRKMTQTNLKIGKTFILWIFSQYNLQMPQNRP